MLADWLPASFTEFFIVFLLTFSTNLPNLLVTLRHTCPIMKQTPWGNWRICVMELQLPWVINIPPGGYVVDLIGAQLRGRVLRRERFGAEPCMKPQYCLELPALPERRGQLLFTRSRTQHFTPFIMCSWVSSSLCACVFCGVFKL